MLNLHHKQMLSLSYINFEELFFSTERYESQDSNIQWNDFHSWIMLYYMLILLAIL